MPKTDQNPLKESVAISAQGYLSIQGRGRVLPWQRIAAAMNGRLAALAGKYGTWARGATPRDGTVVGTSAGRVSFAPDVYGADGGGSVRLCNLRRMKGA